MEIDRLRSALRQSRRQHAEDIDRFEETINSLEELIRILRADGKLLKKRVERLSRICKLTQPTKERGMSPTSPKNE